MINTFGIKYIIEIQNTEKSQGLFCCEQIIVKVCDVGGGPFLAIKTKNFEPTEEYDNHTVTLGKEDIELLCEKLKELLANYDEKIVDVT